MINKRILLFGFVATLSLIKTYAQNLPLFTQYREYNSFINPGSISQDYFLYEYNLTAAVSNRSQWIGVENGPKNLYAKLEYVHNLEGSFNLFGGIHLIKDDTDPSSFTGFYGRVGTMFSKDPYYGGFALGLAFGRQQFSFDTNKVTFLDQNDPINSNAISNQSNSDVGLGLFYFKRFRKGKFKDDDIYMGFSMPQILNLDLNYLENQEIGVSRLAHYYVNIGAHKYIAESSFFEPSIWLKFTDQDPLHLDFLLRYYHNNLVWLGLGVSNSSSLNIEIGYIHGANKGNSKALKIGYGFSTGISAHSISYGTSHEINVSYSIDTNSKRKFY